MSRFYKDLRLCYIESSLWANAYAQNPYTGEIVPLGDTTLDGYVDCLDVETHCPTFADDVETFYNECIDAVADKFGEGSPEDEAFHAMTASDFAHDFALTRAGHGAGFWDRGLGSLGDFLSDLCRPWGSADLEVWTDADGEIHVAAM